MSATPGAEDDVKPTFYLVHSAGPITGQSVFVVLRIKEWTFHDCGRESALTSRRPPILIYDYAR
jgi:hypothetical protein